MRQFRRVYGAACVCCVVVRLTGPCTQPWHCLWFAVQQLHVRVRYACRLHWLTQRLRCLLLPNSCACMPWWLGMGNGSHPIIRFRPASIPEVCMAV
jgi:hypothetical protein